MAALQPRGADSGSVCMGTLKQRAVHKGSSPDDDDDMMMAIPKRKGRQAGRQASSVWISGICENHRSIDANPKRLQGSSLVPWR